MTTISPDPFPQAGLRKLSLTETLQRLKALRCTLPQDNRPTCSGQARGGWTFAGLPLRRQFLGLFSTVASVGLANLMDDGLLPGRQSWADDNLQIHPAVELTQ